MTQSIRIGLFSVAALVLVGCSAKPASSAQADQGDGSATGSVSSQGADATFSATIDGVAVTGKGVQQPLQLQNAAFVLPRQGAGTKHVMFVLASTKDGNDTQADYSLTFRFPPHTGTFVHSGSYESCTCDIMLAEHIVSGNLAQYHADTVTITVTSMTATRIAGTFSGNFKLSNDTPNATQKRATVTNGKFDIPMSTGNVTPE